MNRLLVATLVLLIACGDNLAAPPIMFDLPPGGGQSAASSLVRAGTYTAEYSQTPFGGDPLVSYVLSHDGTVLIEIAGLRRGDAIEHIRVEGKSAREPVIRVLDQVGRENVELVTIPRDTSLTYQGVATFDLDPPLTIGSFGEHVYLVVTANNAPVTLYSLDWGSGFAP